jgi:type II secretory pathway component PulK
MKQRNRGTTYLGLIAMMSLAFILCAMLLDSSSQEYLNAANLRDAIAARNFAEAGIQRALYELNFGAEQSVNLENIALGKGAYSVRLSTVEGKPMLISTGSVPAEKPRIKKTVRAELRKLPGGYSIAQVEYF